MRYSLGNRKKALAAKNKQRMARKRFASAARRSPLQSQVKRPTTTANPNVIPAELLMPPTGHSGTNTPTGGLPRAKQKSTPKASPNYISAAQQAQQAKPKMYNKGGSVPRAVYIDYRKNGMFK
jgi:hypothetical protein